MDTLDCPSRYCRHYGRYELCNCDLASRSGSAATVQECRAYRKIKENEALEKEVKPCGCNGGPLQHLYNCKGKE